MQIDSNLIVFLCISLIVTNVQLESTESNKGQEDDFQLLKVKVIEVSDTFVVVNVTGKVDFQGRQFDKLNLTGSFDRVDNKKHNWVPVDEGFQFNVTPVGTFNNETKLISNLMKITNLKPNQLYRFTIEGKYGNVIYVATDPSHLDITTKPLAPDGTIKKQVNLSLVGTNVKTYYVQVDKVVKRNKLETVINSTIAASHTQTVTLDDLVSGTRYSVKLWYQTNDKKISAVKTIDFKA